MSGRNDLPYRKRRGIIHDIRSAAPPLAFRPPSSKRSHQWKERKVFGISSDVPTPPGANESLAVPGHLSEATAGGINRVLAFERTEARSERAQKSGIHKVERGGSIIQSEIEEENQKTTHA